MNRLMCILATSCAVAIGANAAIMTTFEAAGATQTTQTGVIVETFTTTPLGVFSGASAVGTFSAGGQLIKNHDIYGSTDPASGKYLTIGLYATGTTTVPDATPFSYSLTFAGPISYFGFYWAAVDGDDEVTFYNGATSLATFTKANLFGAINCSAAIPSPYCLANGAESNPALRTKEAYAFVNFFGTSGTTFDKVTFKNGTKGTGFETDNYTILDGTVRQFETPEPATFGLVGMSLAVLAYSLRKRSA